MGQKYVFTEQYLCICQKEIPLRRKPKSISHRSHSCSKISLPITNSFLTNIFTNQLSLRHLPDSLNTSDVNRICISLIAQEYVTQKNSFFLGINLMSSY